MENMESEVIQHLVEVEAAAEKIVSDAENQASKQIVEAKTAAEAKFEEAFAIITEENEKKYIDEKASLEAEYNNKLDEIKKGIETASKDDGALKKYLEEKLF